MTEKVERTAARIRPGRLRSGLRRHGLVRRPLALRAMLARRVLRFTDGNRIETFENGFDGLEAIRGARRRVHLET